MSCIYQITKTLISMNINIFRVVFMLMFLLIITYLFRFVCTIGKNTLFAYGRVLSSTKKKLLSWEFESSNVFSFNKEWLPRRYDEEIPDEPIIRLVFQCNAIYSRKYSSEAINSCLQRYIKYKISVLERNSQITYKSKL